MAATLESSILRILDAQGKTVGAGFVVSENLAVTCAHVVEDAGGAPGGTLRVVFHTTGEEWHAQVHTGLWRPADEEDVAFLHLEGGLPEGIQPILLSASQGTDGHPFSTLGFPEANPEGGVHGGGHILGETRLGMEGDIVLQLSSPQVTPGFSGAPVYDTITERVIGMVTAIADPDQHGRLGETAFITSTETLRAICPELQLSDICPYCGLAAFTEADERFFHGRTALIQRLVESLKRQPRFLAVLGPSGSGKSSLVQAGLIPALRKGAILDSEGWHFFNLRPGEDPFRELAAVGLTDAIAGLPAALQMWIVEHPQAHPVLLLDQFEELFTASSPEIRQAFLAQLVALLECDLPVTVILTMRDDFYSAFTQQSPVMARWLERGLVNVPLSLSRAELREMIVSPSEMVGIQFETGLVEALVDDVTAGEAEGASTLLPLLEFALTQLWERRREGLLTHAAYQAVGGVTGGLAAWADRAYRAIPPEQRGLVRHVLTYLVHLGEEKQNLPDTRRRVGLRDLVPAEGEAAQVQKVIQALTDARLLVTHESAVEITHEILLRSWPQLREWLEDDRDNLRLREGVSDEARKWDAVGRDESLLAHRGARLDLAWAMSQNPRYPLNVTEKAYLDACVAVREREKAMAARRRRWLVGGVSAVLVVILVLLAGWGISSRNSAARLADQVATSTSAQGMAQQLADIALGRQAAAQSQLILLDTGLHMIQSGLLAVEGLRYTPEWAADIAARRVLGVLGLPIAQSIHNGTVSAVDFSPDGSLAVSGGGDGIARVFDSSTGNQISSMVHDNWVLAVAFNLDGDRVVSGSADGTARVWDTTTGGEVARMVHEGSVNAVAFSPDGRWVVSGSDDRTSRVWEASTGIEIARLTHEGVVYAVDFSPDGNWIVSGCMDGIVHVWEAATGVEISLMSLGYEVDAVYDVDFSSNGDWVVSGSMQGDVVVWEAATGIEIAHMNHDGEVNAVSFSPGMGKVVSGSIDGTARVWETNTGIEIARMTHDLGVNAVAFSQDGNWVVSGSWDGTARVWEAATGIEVARMTHEISTHAVSFDPTGIRVMTGGCDEGDSQDDCKQGVARVWEVETGAEVTHLAHEDVVRAVAFSPDGRRIVSGGLNQCAIGVMCERGIARVWDLATGKEIAHMLHADGVDAVAFSPDGHWVVSGSYDGAVIVWDAANGIEISRIRHEYTVGAVSFSPDGRQVISGSLDGAVIVWEAATGAEVTRVTFEGDVYEMAFSPYGRGVVSEGYGECDESGKCLNGIGRVFDIATGAEIAHFVQEGEIYALAVSPDGQLVASGSWDGTAVLWEATTGVEVARVIHDHGISSVTIDADGYWITSSEGSIRVWEAGTGIELARITQETWVLTVAFSLDRRWVASGSRDGTVRVWAWQPADLIDELCRRLPRNFTQEEWRQFFGDTPYNQTCSNLP